MFVRFLKFFASRLVGTGVDTFVLWLASSFLFSSYVGKYLVAPALSFEVAMLHNYTISYFWIWRKRIRHRGAADFFRRLLPYNLSVLFGFGVKMVLLLLLERLFHWDVVWCNLGALTVSGVINFFLGELVVFKKRGHSYEDGLLLDVETGWTRGVEK
ncbi:hypothetical protein Spith_0058 [Spirochaeta thermophila DSM 6578]|uniref:GtrA/DPMS transmembrane domain-containing protein n=1 Tax=Winmispira thermophila (strain ATCC 700085 / DSM 6578 / Z-1203) TaxID=869211 RepID=G0GBI6_WINT7|nr:GtrA family protein [Spirochaeta thermophila]AEJ60345.1 hypothetical protein Spith_0058 [Spirochaeta thermophila DSM 6578]